MSQEALHKLLEEIHAGIPELPEDTYLYPDCVSITQNANTSNYWEGYGRLYPNWVVLGLDQIVIELSAQVVRRNDRMVVNYAHVDLLLAVWDSRDWHVTHAEPSPVATTERFPRGRGGTVHETSVRIELRGLAKKKERG